MPNAPLLCRDEEEDEGRTSMLTVQEEKPDSRLGCRVKTAWRRWTRRRCTSKTFTSSKESSRKGFWRWSTLRHLLLQSGSGCPRLVTGDHLQPCFTCQSAGSPQSCFTCSPSVLGNSCFQDDGELVMSPCEDRGVGRPFLETRSISDAGQRVPEGEEDDRSVDGAPGSCNMFRAFCRHTAPEVRLHFGEETDSDLEVLLVEDEDGGGGGDEKD